MRMAGARTDKLWREAPQSLNLTRYSQLVFTVLTVELRVAVEKKALLATRNLYHKEGPYYIF